MIQSVRGRSLAILVALILLSVTMGFQNIIAQPLGEIPEPLTIAASSETPSDAQASEVPCDDITIQTRNDPTTMRYLQTDFETRTPTFEEIQEMNATVSAEIEASNQVPPFIPGECIPEEMNISRVSIAESGLGAAPLSRGYFTGHTWGSEFGPHDTDTRAVPVTPAAEGHWFPKESYARIYYYAFLQPGMKLHLRVERDQDTYSRYFRVFFGSTKVLERVITNSWEGDIQIGSWGLCIITLEIHYGGYKDKGWQLRYYHLFDSEGQPYDTNMEMFRKKSSSELVYRFPMGPNTKLHIESANLLDPYNRYIYIYIDNYYWRRINSPGAYVIDLPDFSTPGMHEIKFVLHYGGFIDYGKGLKHYWVNYEYRMVEVDWMVGSGYNHQQPSAVFDYLEAYWIVHDYRRVTFVPDTSVPYDYDITWDQYKVNYRNVYFNHIGQTGWVYGLFAHYMDPPNKWGTASLGFGFVIGDEASYYLLDYRIWILMHEYGHVEAMEENSGGVPDIYGSNRVISYHYYHCSSWDQYLAYARSYW